MIVLGIETSCDETALSIVDIQEGVNGEKEVKILANQVLSQIELHKQYGGVFPMMAKREHAKNLLPLFKKVLEEASFSGLRFKTQDLRWSPLTTDNRQLATILEREPELSKQFLEFIPTIEKPPIDLIAVTVGPGLEPALWVGINFAKALSVAWGIPVVPTNHMEGHVLISLLKRNEDAVIHDSRFMIQEPALPALALLISGGHTEMVLMKNEGEYEIVGRTRDDAVGEAFDKVARILGLPYPGGPPLSALAEAARTDADLTQNNAEKIKLPRPMLHSNDLDFSFSGLKTAVLYLVKKLEKETSYSSSPVGDVPHSFSVSPRLQSLIAREFEDAATEVVVEKVRKAVKMYGVQTLILGGGVVANKNIRGAFEILTKELGITLYLPAINHATDNALMIAIAGYFNRTKALTDVNGLSEIKAEGNLSF